MSPETDTGKPAFSWQMVKLLVTVLSIPLMRLELSPHFFPKWFSDYGYGLMFRLGILFGLVVLFWDSSSHRQWLKLRNPIFLAASVGSAVLAVWLGGIARDNYEMLIITVSGAVCLALSQKFILGASWKQAVAAMVLAPGFYFLVTYGVNKLLPEGASAKEFIASYMPYYWQLGYLLGMFGMLDLIKKSTPVPPSAVA